MDRLLRGALAHIRRGNLVMSSATGRAMRFGDGTGPPIAARFTSKWAQLGALLDPELRFGEAYMDGTFVVEQGSITDFLDLVAREQAADPPWAVPLAVMRYAWRRLSQLNWRSHARDNVAHHYDLDHRLYSLFLDSDRQYSCGYFETPTESLDDAQLAKKRHLAAKLLAGPGSRILDIGCGWGGLALYLAEFCRAKVTGITLSNEQLEAARARAGEGGLGAKVDFRLTDYRDVEGTFDRIVSVGMFEHVGVGFYDAFFRKCAALLAEDGVMVLHSIGRSGPPNATNPWIRKYIFPGGYIPSLSEVIPAIERAGLVVTDVEILRLHYAQTLAAWRERFLAHRDDVQRIYDARFVRMWEFYLACSEVAFRHFGLMVFQLQLARRQDAVPLTRDYLAQAENTLRALDRAERTRLRLAGE
jgi:cyclopropane-fatty-acyl-phospholipid synthase